MAENPFAAEQERRKRLAQGLPPLPTRTAPRANPFALEIERRRQAAAGAPTFWQAAGRAALRRYMDNFLNLGDLLANPGDNPAAAIAAHPAMAALALLQQATGQRNELPPASDLIAGAETLRQMAGGIPTPQATAAAQAYRGGIPFDAPPSPLPREGIPVSQRFALQSAVEDLTSQRFAEQAPVATITGDVGGDVATLMTGRAPLARYVPRGGPRHARGLSALPPGLRRTLDDAARGFTRNLSGGLAKAAETGLEGATLAILNKGDPVETAFWAAGGQAAGSMLLHLATKPQTRLIPYVVGTAILTQAFTAVGPGERNFFESYDKAINGLIATAGLGVLAAAAGAGRISGRRAQDLPKITDAINAIPRGAALSLLQDLTAARDKGDDTLFQVLEKTAAHPDAFGTDVINRLNRAFIDGKIATEVDSLMKSQKFRDTLDDLSGSRE